MYPNNISTNLDLAPKIKHTLYLWNPLDYIRLIYWVFYFPQALLWYVKNFNIEDKPLRYLKLSLQGFLLTLITTLVVSILLNLVGFGIYWLHMIYATVFCAMFGIVLGMIFGAASGIASEIIFGIAFGLAFGLAIGLLSKVILGVALAILLINFIVFKGFDAGFVQSLIVMVILAQPLRDILISVKFWEVFFLVSLRLDNLLISLIFSPVSMKNNAWFFPNVTLLPHLSFIDQLNKNLQHNWESGVANINQVITYSFQLIYLIPMIKKLLLEIPEDKLIYNINYLVDNIKYWNIITFFIKSSSRISVSAITNGFWYLHEKNTHKAIKCFTKVRPLVYGEEIFILSETLLKFHQAEEVKNIANLIIPIFPTENLLRPTTWQTIKSLRRVVEDVRLIQQSASQQTKSLAYSRAIGELTEVIYNKDIIPKVERELIIDIAISWKKSLNNIAKDIAKITITKPVRNPHIVGNPVTGNSFVGREDILRQLEELWITSNQLQSVVLYGHRRMGKTSILVNIANSTGTEIKVIYVNLQRLGAVSQGVAEVLMAISDEIAEAFKIAPPDDDAFLKIPQRTFERYLKQVIADMPYRGLIIALDEFETIEELIQQGQIDPGFMGFLRGLVQMSPKIAFAFAGLHTLQEMTADYFQPFFASVIPIRVSFLNAGATKTILANPISNISEQNSFLNNNDQTSADNELEEEFLLDYTGEALDLIYSLTSGQPYLVQLIGFQLVRNYNDQVFEQGTTRDNTFTVEDVNKVVNENLFQQGRYYFEGVWGQAAQDIIGQQDIITAIAPHPQGLTIEELASATGLDTDNLTAAIEILKRHDVIKESDGKYRIIVELFRRWALTVIT